MGLGFCLACGDGAIGGATSAALTPLVLSALDPNYDPLTTAQTTTATAIAMLAGGAAAGLLGQNATAGATWAENEAINNAEPHFGLKNPAVEGQEELRKEMSSLDAHAGLTQSSTTEIEDGTQLKTFMPGVSVSPGNATNGGSMSNILLPNGQPIGVVMPGAGQNIQTVTAQQFIQIESQLMQGSTPVATPAGYSGTWYQMLDGSVFGIRTSQSSGATIDVIKSNNSSLPSGFKVHQK